MKNTRVIVADSSASFLMSTVASLSQLPQVEIVGYATTGGEALRMVESLAPDVFIFDTDMLGLAEWEALSCIREQPAAPRVVITAHSMNEDSYECARAVGADVCLSKDELGRKLFLAACGSSLQLPETRVSAPEPANWSADLQRPRGNIRPKEELAAAAF
jgi:DNA-binding NarL/FixJ family response regulator